MWVCIDCVCRCVGLCTGTCVSFVGRFLKVNVCVCSCVCCAQLECTHPAPSPSSLPVISLPLSSVVGPKAAPGRQSGCPICILPVVYEAGRQAGVRGCQALPLDAEAACKIEDLAVGGAASGFRCAPNHRPFLRGSGKRHWSPRGRYSAGAFPLPTKEPSAYCTHFSM